MYIGRKCHTFGFLREALIDSSCDNTFRFAVHCLKINPVQKKYM